MRSVHLHPVAPCTSPRCAAVPPCAAGKGRGERIPPRVTAAGERGAEAHLSFPAGAELLGVTLPSQEWDKNQLL